MTTGRLTTGRLNSHDNIRVVIAGELLKSASAAMILLHGRGASAQSMIDLAGQIAPRSFAVFAPQATEASWYPYRFVRPNADNEPKLSSAIQAVGRIVGQIVAGGIPAHRIFIGGFSQGACVALEYVARNPQRYGGVIAFSGGLIGDESEPLAVPHTGKPLAGTPVFIGSAELDAHIPLARVDESATILHTMGANVSVKVYPGDAHAINDDEITHALGIIKTLDPS